MSRETVYHEYKKEHEWKHPIKETFCGIDSYGVARIDSERLDFIEFCLNCGRIRTEKTSQMQCDGG